MGTVFYPNNELFGDVFPSINFNYMCLSLITA